MLKTNWTFLDLVLPKGALYFAARFPFYNTNKVLAALANARTFLSSLTTIYSEKNFCVDVKLSKLLGIFGMPADVIRFIRLCVVVK